MKTIGLMLLCCGVVAAAEPTSDSLLIPSTKPGNGWTRVIPSERYGADELYQYIDGGADLVLELGFSQLTMQRYVKGEQEIDLELYHMADADGALALYLSRVGKETPTPEIPCRNSVGTSQVLAVKGRLMAVLNLMQGDADAISIATLLGKELATAITGKDSSRALGILSRDGLVAGSERLAHGALSTPQVFRISRHNSVPSLDKQFAAIGDYLVSGGQTVERLVVPFSDVAEAAAAFKKFPGEIDPSYRVTTTSGNELAISPEEGPVLAARLKGRVIEIEAPLR
jgi:hypothetical protein